MLNSLLKYCLLVAAAGFFLMSCDKKIDLPDDVAAEMNTLVAPVDYTYDVKPILSDRCFACHGPDANHQKANLRLDMAEVAYKKEAESGLKAIKPGKPGSSELVHRILSADPDIVMPTPESHLSLTAREKAILIRWVEEGAEYKPHWAFTKVEKPALPKLKNEAWVRNDIDRFILKKLEDKNVKPSPEASKTTLLRRVSLDLTGLPPTPEEVKAFLNDKSPNAYEKVVDRLLASPHYGEHMAVPWLDAARYADTHGYQDDGLRTAWPFRDWVISSFNKNQPYDQFVTWQLAGDMLPNPTRDMMVATAFNRMHQQSQEGGIIPEEYRSAYVSDRVDTFGKTFLGLTVECARCHDHKYDPISHKDYYSLYAFFNNNDENGQIPYNGEASPAITLPTPEADAQLKYIHANLAKERSAMTANAAAYETGFQQWLATARTAPEKALVPEKTDLLGHFTFDEPTGKEFTNLANPKHKAKAEGDDSLSNVASRNGRIGKARYIFGENAVSFGDNFAFFERNQPFSISIWLNLHDPAVSGSLLHKSNGVMNGYRGWNVFREKDGRIRLTISHVWPENAIEIQTVDKFPMNKWTQLGFTYDGLSKAAGLKLFVNGQPVKITVYNDHLTESILFGKNKTNWYVDKLNIGRLSDQRTKNFEVDEFRIYTRAISPLEMQGLFTLKDELLAALKTPSAQLKPVQLASLKEYYLTNIDAGYKKELAASRALIGEETEIMDKQIDVMVMKERKYPRKTFILNRGAYDAPGKPVSTDTPDAFFKIPKEYPRNRLGLAKWLLDKDHPLFTRVTVNRFWMMYFGKGIVISSDDYGNQGELPTHPELLDYLAASFRESGWNVKAIQKLIVTSATYRQSSKIEPAVKDLDPDNRLYARGPSYRMSAEQIRDNALASSGLLTRRVGGKSAYPYQPAGLWEALATRNEVTYKQQHGDSLYRRSLYTIWKRSSPPPMMLNFDAAERHFCITKRQKTSTPLQALVVMNDPQFVEASRVLAQHMLKNGQTIDEQIDYAFTALTSRLPDPKEKMVLKELYDEELKDFSHNPKRMKSILAVGEYPLDKTLNPAQLAAGTIVASTVMNFDEFLIKR
ncbi:Planctomycete cytochrome C [Dyadobacter sp. SG02]|nr:Planctomycete cytochrome C [Dyadobacter sp. SG02]